MKREMYYGKKFESREELEGNHRIYRLLYKRPATQRGLGVLTPMEFHEKQRLAEKMLPDIHRATQNSHIF
ncbi:MAG: IS3 family transposase [Anaerobutyricum hallii]